jgi:hypothetical protein
LPLHIVYTDIKGAFPSVPYRAFNDALECIGLDGPFLELVLETQKDITITARGPTGLSSEHPKSMGVHEGDCMSLTLFVLFLNMFFLWLRSNDLVYTLTSHEDSPAPKQIKISSNGYADNLALFENSHDEAAKILHMLKNFLNYNDMELSLLKCGYQFCDPDPFLRPPPFSTKWGLVPMYTGNQPDKYLGFHVNIRLNFTHQYRSLVEKLEKASQQLLSRQRSNII